jgi:putative drug exporter of the RND superfamily
MSLLLYRLAHLCIRRRRRVVAAWLAVLIGIGAASVALGGETTDAFTLPGTESQEAFDLLEERFPSQGGSSTRVVFAAPPGATLTGGEARRAIEDTFQALASVEGVALAAPPDQGGATSSDGRVAFGEVRYPVGPLEVEDATTEAVEAAVEPARDAGLTVEFGGDVIPGREFEPPSSEAIGLLFAVVVLLLSFGSVLAMGLPIVTALVGLGIGISAVGVLSAFTDVSSVTPTLAVMIGMAVGIDYALFIVTRQRQNIGAGMDVEEAAARANGTAGSAVVFAGMTVVIAISGLAVVGIPFLTLMGLAAAGTVAVAVLVAVTLLPALLGFVGRNIDRLRVPGLRTRTGGAEEGDTFASRWAARVTHHPVPWLLAALVVMALLAAPAMSMRLGLPDAGVEPESTTQRQAYDLLAAGFGPGFNAPLTVVVDLADAGERSTAVRAVQDALAGTEGVLLVNEPRVNPAGDTAVLVAIPRTAPAEAATQDLIHHLRDDVIPPAERSTGVRVAVTGTTAALIDVSEKLGAALPVFMVLVIGLIFLLLLVVFRSILIPIKAALAILVSIGSSFGVVVAVFQWGWLSDLVGVEETMPIISFLPLMMFAIVFGLSMDYELFILSRVREDYVHNGHARRAVLTGLAGSARVITAAALIMVSVFGAFVLGDNAIIKMFGLGLSVAVLLDATVVRMVIVPAVLSLFDEKAWWLPRWLDRLVPNVDVEGERLTAHLAEVAVRQVAGTGAHS